MFTGAGKHDWDGNAERANEKKTRENNEITWEVLSTCNWKTGYARECQETYE